MALQTDEIRSAARRVPGGGIYTPRQAGSLAGVSGRHIGQWARRKLITPHIYEGLPANLYSYQDVAEAIAVRWLLDLRFSFDQIHTAIEEARTLHPEWPLLDARLGVARQSVDDRGSLVLRDGDVYMETGRGGTQITLRPEFLDFVKDVLRSGGWIARSHRLRKIEVDPQTLGGRPRLKGRRWAVYEVARISADSRGQTALRREYGLGKREIAECLIWTEAAAAL